MWWAERSAFKRNRWFKKQSSWFISPNKSEQVSFLWNSGYNICIHYNVHRINFVKARFSSVMDCNRKSWAFIRLSGGAACFSSSITSLKMSSFLVIATEVLKYNITILLRGGFKCFYRSNTSCWIKGGLTVWSYKWCLILVLPWYWAVIVIVCLCKCL